ncbi:CobW family GTP-binding protein [Calderihabitans maritimus]|uniref:Cobalamin synthesis protein P47K n=1 Tax=Calderihabitans maritimus TaxID=1246530 RepID=A0A1Z5HNF9_9FIRM|nr:GTP-binding protein [Calderihabitans maritimus]GAW91059.1 cobalamin synthesis protein P47K [Calderihabitans maritimus]
MLVEVVNGLLGSGKTTYLLNRMEQLAPKQRVVVLVNEFGKVGIDGDLLGGRDTEVVELPNGCICCTLNADLRNQVKYIAENYAPDWLLVEPTGVATIKNLLGIFSSLSLEKYIDDIKVTIILDAEMFEDIMQANRQFVINQIVAAQKIVINKCDLVSSREAEKIREEVRKINGRARVSLAVFGREIDYGDGLSGTAQDNSAMDSGTRLPQDEVLIKGYQEFSKKFTGKCSRSRLREFFEELKIKRLGDIDRAKGIFYTDKGQWIRMDLAGRGINEEILSRSFEFNKVVVIGTNLDTEQLEKQLIKCLTEQE